MNRTMIQCPQCSSKLRVPLKTGLTVCPKCDNEIRLKFVPKYSSVPVWLNKKLGGAIIILSLFLLTQSMWFENIFDGADDIILGCLQWICFAGVLILALSDPIRSRADRHNMQLRLIDSKESEAQPDTDGGEVATDIEFGGAASGSAFYFGIGIPLLMILVSIAIPSVGDYCLISVGTSCNAVGTEAFFFFWSIPLITALLLIGIGNSRIKEGMDAVDFVAGAKASAIIALAFFLFMSMITMMAYTI